MQACLCKYSCINLQIDDQYMYYREAFRQNDIKAKLKGYTNWDTNSLQVTYLLCLDKAGHDTKSSYLYTIFTKKIVWEILQLGNKMIDLLTQKIHEDFRS